MTFMLLLNQMDRHGTTLDTLGYFERYSFHSKNKIVAIQTPNAYFELEIEKKWKVYVNYSDIQLIVSLAMETIYLAEVPFKCTFGKCVTIKGRSTSLKS